MSRSAAGAGRGRILIADADTASRRMLRDELEGADGLVVVAGTGSGVEALELATHYRPDIALLDLPLPDLDGLSLTRRLAGTVADVSVLVRASDDSIETQFAVFRAGGRGFVSKSRPPADVVVAVRAVLRGEAVVPAEFAAVLVERLHDEPESGRGLRPIRSNLTAREWEVADLMCSGFNTQQIAAELTLSEETVYTHIKHLLRKLEVHSREEAVEAANRLRDEAGEHRKSAK